MNKPTTEEIAAYLMEQSRIWSEGSHDRELLCSAAARLRERERENAEMRAALEMCIPWTEVAIDKMDPTPLATGRLEKVRGFKKLLKEGS